MLNWGGLIALFDSLATLECLYLASDSFRVSNVLSGSRPLLANGVAISVLVATQ